MIQLAYKLIAFTLVLFGLNSNLNSHVDDQSAQISEETLDSYLGQYKAKESGLVVISRTEKGIHIGAGGMESDLFAKTPILFAHQKAPLTFEFVLDSEKKVRKFIVRENNAIVEEAIKL